MSVNPPRQPSLFGDEPDNEPSALIALAAVSQPRTPAQRSFNRLIERIGRLRESLMAWDTYIPRFQQRLHTDLMPIEDAIKAAQRRLVFQLDVMLAVTDKSERLSRAHDRKVRDLLLHLADEVLKAGPDPEVEAAYDRHGELPHAEQRQFDAEFDKAMAEDIFGPDAAKGHDAKSTEDPLHYAGDSFAENAQDRHRAKAEHGRRRTSRRQDAAQARAAAAREAATLSVREVYRRLARTLHPDREPDPTARERKTLLMQRANQAYEKNDLLTLLTLQLETEQIDAGTLASLPAERIAQYNLVLKEQVSALEAQIEERIVPFRIEFDLMIGTVTPQLVDQALSARVVEAEVLRKDIDRTTKQLADPRTRRAALKDLPDVAAEHDDYEEIAAFAEMMVEMGVELAAARERKAPKSKPKGKKGKRKKR